MSSDQFDPGAPFDEVLAGRHSLRLVKLRLALTLIAVAILPLAALAPIVRTVLDDPRLAQRERLTAQSDHMTTETRRELEAIRTAMLDIAATASVGDALGPNARRDAMSAAGATLTTLLSRPSGLVSGVGMLDAAGKLVVRAGDPKTTLSDVPATGSGASPIQFVPAAGATGAHLELSVPIPGPSGGGAIGSVVAAVPLGSLLDWLSADFSTSAERLSLVDASGHELAGIATTSDPSATGQPSIVFTADPATRAAGTSELGIPGQVGWHLVGSAPMTVAELPLPMIALLGLLLGLLGIFIRFMTRRILAPAAALEEQRARFHDLYMSAREAALQDHLTGLGNHRAFQEAVGRLVEQSRRHGHTFALALLDIDEFKQVNDTRGHAVGDDLLIEVGNLIRATIRGSDAGFRIGGDEFAILLAGTDSAGAAITAKRILGRGLEDRGTGSYRGPISFSAGVTACPEFGRSRVELTGQADAALYRGKRAGRTIVSIYDPLQDRGHVDETMRAELSAAVAAVVESASLRPVYQPIVDLATGRILGFEGLVRVDPASGFAHTGALFDAAEIAGRVLDLDRAALEVVLGSANQIPAESLISLNVSPRSFEAPEFGPAAFLAILRRHRMAPERVLLELTERDVIQDPDRLRSTIQTIQQAGVRVAADDVGAGNAGLRLLSQFRFDVVKIDLSLVQGGASQDQTLAVLTSLVDLARRWGALTIAEGVETPDQLQMIRQLGVDAGQGYLLGRPVAQVNVEDRDLDALAGPASAAPIDVGVRTMSSRASFFVQPAVVAPAPPVPTAASVLSGPRPAPFRPSQGFPARQVGPGPGAPTTRSYGIPDNAPS